MKMTASWDIVPCSLVVVGRFFRARLHGAISQEVIIFIVQVVPVNVERAMTARHHGSRK
jgi:hypothetical protein